MGAPEAGSNELEKLYLECIHCGLCLPSCPTYRETGNEAESPRGRIYLMRALAEGRLAPDAGVHEHLDACVGCRACESACPAGVHYGDLLERARAQYVEPSRPAGMRTRFWRPLIRQVLPYRQRFSAMTLPARLARRWLVKAGHGPSWLPEAMRRPLEVLPEPQPSAPLPEWTAASGIEKGTVAFLEGCAMPVLYSQANHATVRMLARAGYRVWVPRAQGCCGAVSAHDGDREGARRLARANVAAFEAAEVVAVISNAAGCGAALKGYAELLADDLAWADRARALSTKARDFSEFLAEAELPPPPRPTKTTVTYHDPCHLAHGQRVREAPRRLIKAVPGVRYVELQEADWCCGGAGSYTLLNPEMSDKLLAHKVRHIQETGAAIVVTANPPCLMQVGMGLRQAGTPVRLMHLAEFLDEAYR
jgi:glycolate oxidase iron-sulfur subunit